MTDAFKAEEAPVQPPTRIHDELESVFLLPAFSCRSSEGRTATLSPEMIASTTTRSLLQDLAAHVLKIIVERWPVLTRDSREKIPSNLQQVTDLSLKHLF